MATLRALESLVAVADNGSMTKAARVLHSSQPAISQQLASLEREAGTQLFTRDGRGVKLTPAGRAAMVDARKALEAAAAAVRSARAVGAGASGVLRIACAQSLMVSFLAPVIRKWHRSANNVTFTLRESTVYDEVWSWVDDDEVDVAFIAAPVPERFDVYPVAEEEIVLTAPSNFFLAKQSAVRISQLTDVALVHFTPEHGLSTWLDQALAEAGVRPDPVMRTAVTATAPQLAAAGLGVAVTPVSAVGEGFPGAVRSFEPRWYRQLVAVTASTPDPLTARFIDDLRTRGVEVSRDIRQQLGE